jgi:hypothetical protein
VQRFCSSLVKQQFFTQKALEAWIAIHGGAQDLGYVMSTFPRYGSFEAVGKLSITRFKFLAAWARWNKKDVKHK